MANIFECKVQDPDTSGEVCERALNAFRDSDVLRLVLLGQQEVPAPEPITVEFNVARLTRPEGQSMQVAGLTPNGESVVVTCNLDPGVPATAHYVTK